MIERKQIARRLLVLLATALLGTGTASAASDDCVSANVPGPIMLPDGTFHPPGTIRVCLTDRLSPVAGVHETSIAGRPVGMYLSRVKRLEATPESRPDPLFEFTRTEDGIWILDAYSMPDGNRVVLYQLRPATPRSPRIATTRAAAGSEVTVMAALGR